MFAYRPGDMKSHVIVSISVYRWRKYCASRKNMFYVFYVLLNVHPSIILQIEQTCYTIFLNPLNPELNPICYLLTLLAHHFLHVSRVRVKSLTIRLLISYIYMEHLFLMFLDHTQRRTTFGRTPLDE